MTAQVLEQWKKTLLQLVTKFTLAILVGLAKIFLLANLLALANRKALVLEKKILI